MKKVLFVSQNPLGRCENLTAVWDAYNGRKDFKQGQEHMEDAERDGYSVVVCDALPKRIKGKYRCKSINICHAITGNKYYGLHEKGAWVDPVAFAQTDIATAAGHGAASIVAGQLGIPEEYVAVTGLPRTDKIVGKKKGDGGTFLSQMRSYLYLPTFRNPDLGGWIPKIDWAKLDSMLSDEEVFVVKRHYFTIEPLVDGVYKHIKEVDPADPLGGYLMDCDVVVSDYSSSIFDGYLMNKPAVLTLDDSEAYLKDRGMYFRYPDFYCSRSLAVSGHEDELVDILRNAGGLNDTEKECISFLADACDGNACKKVTALIDFAIA